MIGAGGYGEYIIDGVNRLNTTEILAGSILVAALAMFVEIGDELGGTAFDSRGAAESMRDPLPMGLIYCRRACPFGHALIPEWCQSPATRRAQLAAKEGYFVELEHVVEKSAIGVCHRDRPDRQHRLRKPGKGAITVGGKLDVEAQLLTEMYTQLLQNGGYNVNEKLALGNSIIVHKAITSAVIDLYPEFTATGLNTLGIKSSYDPQKDYQAVKSGYENKFQVTWLDMAPLNDGYGICTTKALSQSARDHDHFAARAEGHAGRARFAE